MIRPLLLAALLAAPASAQAPRALTALCGPPLWASAVIAATGAEAILTATDAAHPGVRTLVLANPATGLWQVWQIAETVACLIDAGDAFRPGGAPPVKEDPA